MHGRPPREVNPDIIVLCHGGPIATPEDAQTILQWCPQCHGFYGASSMERLPTEVALTQQTNDLSPFEGMARKFWKA